jgi:site-specific DNA-methyltransferase (adenine-specific)
VIIPLDKMWAQVKRLCKGAFVTTASQPFTSVLVASNLQWFKYEWVWNKALAGNGILADVQPLKVHENVVVFSENGHTYNQQMRTGKARWKGGIKDLHGTFSNAESPKVWNDQYHPTSLLDFSGASMRSIREHPTQKPVALYEYLIKTYTNPGDTVLDFCMGSGTTGCAAIKTGRNFIGIELDPAYYDIAARRIAEAQQQMVMPL